MYRAYRPDKSVLQCFLGILLASEHLYGKRHAHAAVPLDKLGGRLTVSFADTLYELVFGLQSLL